MIFAGFLEIEDENVRGASPFFEMFSKKPFDKFLKERIIKYLDNGIFLTGVMTYVSDDEGKQIGPLTYFTDGKFIWPVYYPYYLKKYSNFIIAPELMAYAQLNNYVIPPIDPTQLSVIEKEFDAEWRGQWKRKSVQSISPPSSAKYYYKMVKKDKPL